MKMIQVRILTLITLSAVMGTIIQICSRDAEITVKIVACVLIWGLILTIPFFSVNPPMTQAESL